MMIGSAARTLGLVMRMAGGFFMMPFLVSRLGDHWYGVFTATLGLIANFHLMDFGFTSATMRQIAVGMGKSDDREVNLTINAALRIYTLLGVIVLITVLLLVALAPVVMSRTDEIATVRWVLFIIGVDLAITFPTKAFGGILQAKLRYDLLLVVEMISFGVTVAGNVWVLLNGYGVVALAIVAFIGGQLNNLLWVILAKYLFPPMKVDWALTIDSKRSRELASYSVWAFLIQLANQLRFRIDSLTVGGLLGGAAITRYTIGARLVEYAQQPLTLVLNTAMPALTKLHVSDQKERTADIVLFLLRISLLLAIYAGGMLYALGRPFISRWMGPEHEASQLIAMVLAIGFLTEVFILPLTNWLYASANHKLLALANATEAVANVVLSIVLGRIFGLLGVAMGTVIPLMLMQLGWVAPQACRMLGMPGKRFMALSIPAAIALLVMTAAGYVMQGTAHSYGYVGMIVAGGAMTLMYWPIVFFVCLGRHDRGFVWRALLPSMA
jgi:O-antigen/teichoic acid export membrane protein